MRLIKFEDIKKKKKKLSAKCIKISDLINISIASAFQDIRLVINQPFVKVKNKKKGNKDKNFRI